jgi:hypothetical protein
MQCPKCGNTIPHTADYCAYCGAPVGVAPTGPHRGPLSIRHAAAVASMFVSGVVVLGALGWWVAGLTNVGAPAATSVTDTTSGLVQISSRTPMIPSSLTTITTNAPTHTLTLGPTATKTASPDVEVTAAGMDTHGDLEAVGSPVTPRFYQVDLRPIANWPLDNLVSPPIGQVYLADLPFTILGREQSIFQTQHHLLMDLPTLASLQVSVPSPTAVHILLNGAYVDLAFRDREVGEIDLRFADGSSMRVPIIAWRCIREDWAYENHTTAESMSASPEMLQWRNVWVEHQQRDGRAAKAFIDMITVPVPEPFTSGTLTSITVKDTSVDSLGTFHPSLKLIAITVESRE